MANFDLRELSAPVEKLRPKVEDAYKLLDTKWIEVSETLGKLPIPVDVGYPFHTSDSGEEYSQLEWRKWKGKKRVCIVLHASGNTPNGWEESEEVIPIEEWSASQRLGMLQFVPNLFAAAEHQTKDFIEKIGVTGGRK